MNEDNSNENKRPLGAYRPKLAFYHPNAKGTGGALELVLHPAHDDVDGCIMARLSSQLTIGDRRGPEPVYPRFDWEGSITVKLDFNDISKMLQVFRGECETLEDGKGLYHQSTRGTTRINLRHQVELSPGYVFECYRTLKNGEEGHAMICLSPHEALGLTAALESSMGVICFGIPMLVEHDTTQYKAALREKRNASAA